MTKHTFSVSLKKELKEIKKQKNISREKFAKSVDGLTFPKLNSYLRTENPVIPPLDMAAAIARELGVSLDYLCGLNEKREVKYTETPSASVVLKNLYAIVKLLQINVTLGKNTETRLKTNNDYVYLFFSQIKKQGDRLSDILPLLDELVVYSGEIMNVPQYDNAKLEERTSEEIMQNLDSMQSGEN
jgi:transcriptional regulator with XRE-family HTH domain